MSSQPVQELRRHKRLPLAFSLFARGTDGDGKPYKELVMALNVSASGMLVRTSARFIPVRHMQIDLPVGDGADEPRPTSRQIQAEIVRMERRTRSRLIGLKFPHLLA